MPDKKNLWDKIDILLKPVGGIVAAATVGVIGYVGSDYLKQRELFDANSRAFAQIVSQREDADSKLRMNMFNSIITKFFSDPKDRAQQVLNLELLAYNFHESLDLAPLFKNEIDLLRKDLKKDRASSSEDGADAAMKLKETKSYVARLERVAKEVAFKQVAALDEGGKHSVQGNVDFDALDNSPQGVIVIDQQQLGDRWFKLEVLKKFAEEKELRVKLTVYTQEPGEVSDAQPHWSQSAVMFRVGFFDFPMIDNTRLSDGKRVSVVLNQWDTGRSATVQLVYFPGSRASLKEKEYYDQLLKDLFNLERPLRGSAAAEAEAQK